MEKLDLHSISHSDVRNEVIRFIEANWKSNGSELEIVTGHSLPMQKIVIDVLKEYELDWRIGDYLSVNKGFIRVTIP
jgi:DNA-nicking Smr family endonuclease